MRRNLPADVEISVYNNGSPDDKDYRSLKRLPNVTYSERKKAGGFHGSFLGAINQASGDVVIVCSDEDVIAPGGIEALERVDWLTVSTVRGSVGQQDGVQQVDGVIHGEARLTRGPQGFQQYGWTNNYATGTAYNTRFFKRTWPLLEANAAKHTWYPHLYLDILCCAVGDVEYISDVVALEGPTDVRADIPGQFNSQYSYGSRLDQHIVFRDGLIDAVNLYGWDDQVFINAYLALCYQTFRKLLLVNSRQYLEAGIDPFIALAGSELFAVAALREYPQFDPDQLAQHGPDGPDVRVRHRLGLQRPGDRDQLPEREDQDLP